MNNAKYIALHIVEATPGARHPASIQFIGSMFAALGFIAIVLFLWTVVS